MAAGMAAGFMGGGGGSGGYKLDFGSGVGDTSTDNDMQFGDWGGAMNIGAPGGGFSLDMSNPVHVLVMGSSVLLVGALLLRSVR